MTTARSDDKPPGASDLRLIEPVGRLADGNESIEGMTGDADEWLSQSGPGRSR